MEQEVSSEALIPLLAGCAPEAAPDRIKELAALLEPFLRSIPQALSVAIQMTKSRGSSRAVAFATGQALDYLFDEDDLLPERDFGILGLLDDAYLAHIYAGMLSRMYPQVDTSGTGYQPPDERTLNVVRSLLPAGIASALERTVDNLLLVAHSLFGSGGGAEGHPSQPAPVLQVSEAIRAMDSAGIR
ncbi:MAG: hypothetical protein ACREEM_20775 [Blastocatellia bacterium]